MEALREISINRLQAPRERLGINSAQDDGIARRRGYLSNAVAHGARAEHSDAPDWASRSVIVLFVRVSAQRALAKTWPNRKVDPNFRPRYWLGPAWFD